MKDPNEALRKADEALRKLVEEKQRLKNEADRQAIMDGVARELPSLVAPLLQEVANNSRVNTDEVIEAIKGITIEQPKVDVQVETPKAEVTVQQAEAPSIPPIDTSGIEAAITKGIASAKFPRPEVTVNTPKIPDFPKFPEIPEFPTEVSIKGVDKKSPFPVMMMGPDGKPMSFAQSVGGGGGRADFFTIKDIQASAGGSLIDADGFLKVTGNFAVSSSNASTQAIDSSGDVYNVANPFPVQVVSGGTATSAVNVVDSSGVAYSGSNPLPVSGTFTPADVQAVSQVSGATWSVSVNDMFRTTVATNLINGDDRLRVSLETGGSGLTDAELRASAVPVSQVSGAVFSISVTDVFGSTGANVINPDGRLKVELPTGASGLTDTELRAAHLDVQQLSGSIDSVYLTGVFGTIGTVTINPDGNPVYGGTSSGGTVQVQDSYGSSITSFGSGDSKGLAVAIVDASGNQITSFGGGTQYSDGATGSTPTGTVAMGDTGEESGNLYALASFSGVVSSGTLRVVHASDAAVSTNITNASIAVTQSGTWNVGTVTAVTDVTNSLKAALIDSSGVQYSGSNPVPITGNIGTVTTVTGVTNSVAVVALDRDGNPLTTGPIGLGDAATALRVVVAGNSDASVVVNSGTITTVSAVTGITNSIAVVSLDRDGNPLTTGPIGQGDEATALRVVHAGNSAVSVTATQTGTWNIGTVTTVTGITNSIAAALIDSSGVQYSTSNPLPIGDAGGAITVDGTVTVGSVTASIASAIVDSTGVMYGSANPMHIAVHDSFGSTITSFGSGDSKGLAVAIVDGSGNQITSFGGGTQYAEGATASTYTGTAMIFAEASSDAAKVVSSVDPLPATLATALSSSIDSILSRPISLRGSLSTAYATLNTNTETTLISAAAGNYLDLVWIKFTNTSTGAVTIDLRDVSAGNIIDTYEVPANASNGISMSVPYPQGNQGNAWTVDYNDADLSNTTVYVSGLFHKTT